MFAKGGLEERWKYVYSWAKRGRGGREGHMATPPHTPILLLPMPPYPHPTVSHRIPPYDPYDPYDPYPDSDGRTSTANPWRK